MDCRELPGGTPDGRDLAQHVPNHGTAVTRRRRALAGGLPAGRWHSRWPGLSWNKEGNAVQTGFPRADAQDDFDRALREARLARLAGWLSGRAPGDRLPVLGEVTITR